MIILGGESNEMRYIIKFYIKNGKNVTQTVKKFITFMDLIDQRF